MYLISQSEFAKKMGVTKSAVSQLVRDGKLPVDGKKIIMPDAECNYHKLKSGLRVSAELMPEVKVFNTGKTILIELKMDKVCTQSPKQLLQK